MVDAVARRQGRRVGGVPSSAALAVLLLAAALVIRLAFVAATPEYALVHDAYDYDRHATSIAQGDGYAQAYGRPTAFRPPGYPYALAALYAVTGVADADPASRIRVARVAGALIGTGIVGLTGWLAAMLWGRRVGLVALALGAVYLPLVWISGSVMSEPLFALLLLAAAGLAVRGRRSPHAYRYALAIGVLAGLTVLTRANGIVLVAPLAVALWHAPRRSLRSLGPPAVVAAVALLTVAPWTVRNAVELDAFVPVSTQLGSAMAGTYNEQARTDPDNPASWRSVRWIPSYRDLWRRVGATPEAAFERELRSRALRYAREHPTYVAEVALWTTIRMLDLPGMDWSRHTLSTIGVPREWADPAVVCFWVFALLAVVGAGTAMARRAPPWVWALPLLLYLSVVLLVVETPRYRTGIDPFVVLLAALAVVRLATAARRRLA